MRPPAYLIKQGITALPCIGDGRQSGTSGSPSILNASPEAAVAGNLALLRTGDRVRFDLRKGTANILISDGGAADAAAPHCRRQGGFHYPVSPDAVAGALSLAPSVSRPPAPAWSWPPAITTSPARSAWPGIITNLPPSLRAKRRNPATVIREGALAPSRTASDSGFALRAPRNDERRREEEMSDRLKGKRAVVTAAAAGIGRACAIALRARGGGRHRHRHR